MLREGCLDASSPRRGFGSFRKAAIVLVVLAMAGSWASAAQPAEPSPVDDKTLSEILQKMVVGGVAPIIEHCSARFPDLRETLRAAYEAHIHTLDAVTKAFLQSPKSDPYRRLSAKALKDMEGNLAADEQTLRSRMEKETPGPFCSTVSLGLRVSEQAMTEMVDRALAGHARRLALQAPEVTR